MTHPARIPQSEIERAVKVANKLGAINQRRFHVQFYIITAGGKKPLRTAVMTLAEIEDITARSNWRAQVGECVG